MPATQTDLDRLVRRTRTQAERLAASHAAGELDATQFGDRMAALLEQAHTRAVRLGRRRGGDNASEDEGDRRFGALVVDEEAAFLASFVRDLRSGRYGTGAGVNAAAIRRRAALYAGRLTGTANEVLTLTREADTLWTWVLGSAEHCPDCPRLAANGPYLANELPTYPGANGTRCLQHCRCYLRSGRTRGFRVTS